jgi:2-hydroxychromene-2-carboxylate isomerase
MSARQGRPGQAIDGCGHKCQSWPSKCHKGKRHGESELHARGWIAGAATAIITSTALRDAARAVRAGARRMTGQTPTVHYFHGVSDPHSLLAAQLLPALRAAYSVRFVPHLVGPPAAGAAPDAERLAAWALRDFERLAEAHGLAFVPPPHTPGEIANAEAAFAPGQTRAEGEALLAASGHYLPAVFAFEGETYWGVDRLPHLEARLAPFRTDARPVVRQLEASEAPGDAGGVTLDFYLSFRSPYTHLAAARVRGLAERHGATLRLRPVLPMVMRGLPVPPAKRMYIVRDAKREAERLGIPFGRICDPVGAGVERGLAVLHRAIALGRGPDFAESFLAGAFAEAVDAKTDAGLHGLAARAGLTAGDVADALADDGWRSVAEANRAELLALGLWGVPAFRVGSRPPHWGQDRLWAVEQDLRAEAAG